MSSLRHLADAPCHLFLSYGLMYYMDGNLHTSYQLTDPPFAGVALPGSAGCRPADSVLRGQLERPLPRPAPNDHFLAMLRLR